MKITFTLFLILFVTAICQAQIPTKPIEKVAHVNPVEITVNPVFNVIKIYPNPVLDFVTIELKSQTSGAIQMNLFNILGTEVKKWEPYHINSGDQKLKLDLSTLKSGIYFLKISKSEQCVTQVIKKN